MKHSQLAPLPEDLPFRIVSKTIGQGAYACIKKACPLQNDTPLFAVKFIHKDYAARHGRITSKQLQMEVALHKHVGLHNNIIAFYNTDENETWRWIAMELAEGGDLFDKIEADEGVGEDIAHVYFAQLINAVGFMHSKGVGHRDIKPENILLSSDGNLKIADFGLATLFEYNGKMKMSTTLCGSPPYIAPEVIQCSNRGQSRGGGYRADLADIWSCGVVLFVLLVGNTPWDSPTDESYEYCEYVKANAKPEDELWQRLPVAVLSLLRGMMKIDSSKRFSMQDVRRHPWFTKQNKYLSSDGRLINPVNMATTMFESLHIDFNQDPLSFCQNTPSSSPDVMLDDQPHDSIKPRFSSTQPEPLTDDMLIDWDGPPRLTTSFQSASQPKTLRNPADNGMLADRLMDEPSMSQFSATPSVPLSRTQNAGKFQDIIPCSGLTRFFSNWPLSLLVPRVCEALQLIHVPASPKSSETSVVIRIRTNDDRKCPISGNIIVEVIAEGIAEVEFVKVKGDPLEWRRFFKKITVLCKDAVLRPDN
ncbi:kinase domain containing protein [Coccidioides posadasii C735 delta SOWgp]|uniref:non-specific serine/threonine protein kinase n=2 Tax=Coccidioides posadasii TaxID=199306 RepID=A0A0J6F6A1_COCPO|nr:kinase domain containing protein [Coccidioides posadasii C735 delta SOWgp]EER23442.1 kinase domain containing protein [Coccidioides posadasii C735 delta SOWgp]KMM64805.1 serine/threonine-protein kinase Chk1 [Coccidioides posadasii RMSCC 3488]|eukprot:XP_003065587.1 kinase domain containing protein [Coccidioides posadasii C735 delta SOWgp]